MHSYPRFTALEFFAGSGSPKPCDAEAEANPSSDEVLGAGPTRHNLPVLQWFPFPALHMRVGQTEGLQSIIKKL